MYKSLMKCGYTANVKTSDKKSCCEICAGITEHAYIEYHSKCNKYLSKEEIDKISLKKAEELDWKKCILIRVDV